MAESETTTEAGTGLQHEEFRAAVDRVANITPQNSITGEQLAGLQERLAVMMGRSRMERPQR